MEVSADSELKPAYALRQPKVILLQDLVLAAEIHFSL